MWLNVDGVESVEDFLQLLGEAARDAVREHTAIVAAAAPATPVASTADESSIDWAEVRSIDWAHVFEVLESIDWDADSVRTPVEAADPDPPTPEVREEPEGSRLKRDQDEAAAHEAGHAVVAALYGAQIDVAETMSTRWDRPIKGPDGAAMRGYCRYEPFNVAVAQSEYLITAAGAAAEAVKRFGPAPTVEQLEEVLGGPDREALRAAAVTAAWGPAARPVDAVREVLPLVLKVWPAIAGLASQIGQRAIHGVDVDRALGVSIDPGQRTFELSNIRAGIRGVPDPRKVWA